MWDVGQEICGSTVYGHLWLTAYVVAMRETLHMPGSDVNGDGLEARIARAAKAAGVLAAGAISRWELAHFALNASVELAFAFHSRSQSVPSVVLNVVYKSAVYVCCSIARADVVQFQRKHTAQFASRVLVAMAFLFSFMVMLYLRCAAQLRALVCFLHRETFLTIPRPLRFTGVMYLQRPSVDAWPACEYMHDSDVGLLDRAGMKASVGEHSAKCGYAKGALALLSSSIFLKIILAD